MKLSISYRPWMGCVGSIGATVTAVSIGYLIKRYWNKKVTTTNEKQPRYQVVNPNSKYKIRPELLPYIDNIELACVYHPAVIDFVNEKHIDNYLNSDPFTRFCGHMFATRVIENPFLEPLFRKMVFVDQSKCLSQSYYINHCPYPDIIEHFRKTKNMNVDLGQYLTGSSNPEILKYIDENIDELQDWPDFSTNEHAVDILQKHFDKIDFYTVCFNKKAGNILYFNQHRIPESKSCWDIISRNQNVYSLFKDNLSKVNWKELSANNSPDAVKLLSENIDKIDWYEISSNSEAISLIKDNLDKIDWIKLSLNSAAIDILKNNIDKINWENLSLNESAADLLLQYPHKIHWQNIVRNKSIPIDFLVKNINRIILYLNFAFQYNPNLANLVFIEA